LAPELRLKLICFAHLCLLVLGGIFDQSADMLVGSRRYSGFFHVPVYPSGIPVYFYLALANLGLLSGSTFNPVSL
jgi:hypothetical protein